MELSATAEALFGQELESLVSRGPLDHYLPREVSVAAFRMRTGYDYLATHYPTVTRVPALRLWYYER
ncbi:hypothetical protein TNCT_717951 [Trichonephila clavata]|uniref:Uncharacterized protein n=1 Tax=Trichonephila clavata TaxID=2740835 RepID=A0A8X6G4T6_TRICU|nr:hypothetical protein TNCT_717951 [Trichonephila clavata]